jgi:hypothetical protein
VQVFDLGSRAILRNFDVSCLISSTYPFAFVVAFGVLRVSGPLPICLASL